MIYLIVLFLIMLCVYAFDLRKHRQFEPLCYWGFFVVFVVIAGLRYRIGTDSIVYERDYENIPMIWELSKFKFASVRYEPGFMVFASIPRSVSSDFTLLQFFHAAVVNLVFFWFIKNNSTHKFLCLAFYFLILYLNLCMQVLREALAVCLFLLAWPSFRDGIWWKYYILVVLAFFFHTSAIVLWFLPFFCLPGIRSLFVIGKRTLLICLVLVLLGLFIQSRFSAVFSALAVTDRMMDRVNEYKDTYFATGNLAIGGILMILAQVCMYPLAAAYFLYVAGKSKDKKKAIKESRFEMMVVAGIYFMILSLTMSIFVRYFNYFGIFCLAAVATWAFSKIRFFGKTYRLKMVYWCLIILPYFALNLYSYNSNANKSGTLKNYMIYYPYYTRLDPQVDSNRENIYRYFDAR